MGVTVIMMVMRRIMTVMRRMVTVTRRMMMRNLPKGPQ